MRSQRRRSGRYRWLWVLLLGATLIPWPVSVGAQEESPAADAAETPPRLAPSEAEEFLGEWVLTLESPQGDFDSDLVLKDADGTVVADFEIPQLGSQTIDQITRTEEGLSLSFALKFGSQQFNMTMELAKDADRIVGKLADKSGLFTSTLTGITRQAFLALETAEGPGDSNRRRRGRRRDSSGETKLTLAEQEISIRFDKTQTGQPAYRQVTNPTTGEVVRFLTHRPGKLMTPADLVFGDAVVKAANVSPDYPGVYSLWLRKEKDGWHLVFNEKPDIWGTQHDPAADVAAVPLDLGTLEEEVQTLTMELKEVDGGGLLRIAWGTHEWTTAFRLAE